MTTTTFRFPSAPASEEAFVRRSRLETAILRYGEMMNALGAIEGARERREVERAWEEVEEAIDALEEV